MNPLLFWKDQFLRDYKTKHKILLLAITHVEVLGETDNAVKMNFAIELSMVINYDKNVIENARAARYLIAAQYFIPLRKDEKEYILLTQKALDAYNSQYFLTEYKAQLRLRNNNRWNILFAGIVAAGVIYSIWKDEFKKPQPTRDKEQEIIKPEPKISDSLKAHTFQNHSLPCR